MRKLLLFLMLMVAISLKAQILFQPVDTTVCEGQNALFFFSDTFPNPSYQWQVFNTTWMNITGADDDSLHLSSVGNAQNGLMYRCLISSHTAPIDTTLEVSLTVLALSVDPDSVLVFQSQLACPGDTVMLKISGGILGDSADWKWYTGGCGQNLIGTGDSIFVFPFSTTLYQVRTEGACNNTNCDSVNVPIVNGLSLQPGGIAAIPTAVSCPGDSTELTVLGGFLGQNANWEWYQGACGGTHLGSGPSINVEVNPGDFFFVRAEDSCGATLCESISIPIQNGPPISPSSISVSGNPNSCPGAPQNLSVVGGILGAGASWEWYEGGCGLNHVGTGNSITVNPLQSTTYYVRYEDSCQVGNCISQPVLVTGTFSLGPLAIVSTGDTISCAGGSTVLTVIGGSLGTGADWYWYDSGCGTGLIDSSGTITVSPSQTTTYFVRAEGECNQTACEDITVTVLGAASIVPDSLSASSATVSCPGDSVLLSLNGGSLGLNATWRWYSGGCGQVFEGSGNSLYVFPEETTTYSLRGEGVCDTTLCLTIQVEVVDSNSSAASSILASPNPISCPNDPSNLTVQGGGLGSEAQWKWYTGVCGGMPVDSGASIWTSPSSSATYYVRAEGKCNTTACDSIDLFVFADSSNTPDSLYASSTSISCQGEYVDLFVMGGYLGTGGIWRWYEGVCGSNPVGNGDSIRVFPDSTTTYFLRGEALCDSTPCLSITIQVAGSPSTLPTAIVASPLTASCPGQAITMSVGGGNLGINAEWKWYEGTCGGMAIGTGDSLVVYPNVATSYFVRAESPCDTSSCVNLLVAVNTLPMPVISGPAMPCQNAYGVEYCISPTGNQINWSVANGSILSGQGTNCIQVQWTGVGNSGTVVVSENVWGEPNCVGEDTMEIALVGGPAPNPVNLLIKDSDTASKILLCPQCNFTYYEWGYENKVNPIEVGECTGNDWCLYDEIDTLTNFYWLKHGDDMMCMTKSYLNAPEPVVEIENYTEVADVKVYPNPTQGEFFISLTGKPEFIAVYNTMGKEVEIEVASQGQETFRVNLPRMVHGVYVLAIRNRGETLFKKIVLRP